MPWPDDDSELPGSWYTVSADVRPPDDQTSGPTLPWYMQPGDDAASYMPDRATTPPPPSRVDDSSVLRGLMDTFVRAPAEGLVTGVGSALTGLGELYGRSTDWANRGFKALGIPDTGVQLPWYLNPGEILRRPGEQFKGLGQEIGVPEERKNYADEIGAGVGQIGSQILALMMTGGAGAVATMFGQGVDQSIDEVRRTGKYGTLEGDAAMVAGGAITAVTEKMGLDLLLNRMPPAIKNKVLRAGADILVAGGIEAAQEFLETVARNGMHNIVLGTNTPMLDGAWDSASVAGPAASIVRGMLHMPRPRASRRAGALSQPTGRDVNFPDMESEPAAMRAQYAGSASLAPYDIPGMNGQMLLPGYEGQNLLPGSDDPGQLPGYGYQQEALPGAPERAPAPYDPGMERQQSNADDVDYLRAPYDPKNPFTPGTDPGSLIVPAPGFPSGYDYPKVMPPKRDLSRPDLRGALSSTPADQTIKDEMGFHSKAVEALRGNAIKTKKARPDQWVGELLSKGGVSPLEIKWSKFVESFGPKQQVTREEVMQHFWDSMPHMTETNLMGSPRRGGAPRLSVKEEYLRNKDGIRRYLVTDSDGNTVDVGTNQQQLENNIKHGAYPGYTYAAPEYSSYFSPSGDNYRESIMNMAQPQAKSYGLEYEYIDPARAGNEQSVVLGNFPTEAAARDAERSRALQGAFTQSDNLHSYGTTVPLDAQGNLIPQPFNNPHWSGRQGAGGENPAAHARMNDIMLPNGEKALHIGELQADWAQGFTQRLRHAARAREKMVERGEGAPLETGQPLSEDERDRVNHDSGLTRTAPNLPTEPHLPYADDSNKSIDLNLKRQIMRAVNEGYDSIVLGTGQENAFNSDEGSVFTNLTFDPNTGLLSLFNPVEDTPTNKHVDVNQSPQQDSMIRAIGKGLAGALRDKVAKLKEAPDARPVYEVKQDPDDTRPLYDIVEDPNDERPTYDIEQEDNDPDESEMATIEEEPGEVDSDSYSYVEEYEEDEDDIPTNDEGEPEHEPRTLYRVLDPHGDMVSEGHETRRDAEQESDDWNDSIEPDNHYVVRDPDGEEIARYSVADLGNRRAERNAQSRADDFNSNLERPAEYHVLNPDGERVDSFDDRDDAEAAIAERGGRLVGSASWVARAPDGTTSEPFSQIRDARHHVTQLGGRHDESAVPFIVEGPNGERAGPFEDMYDAHSYITSVGGRRPDERKRANQLPMITMGPDEVVPKGQDYAISGSGYHKTYDNTVVNRANKLLQGFDKKARLKVHDPEAVIKAKQGSASALFEAMTQNRKTLAEMKALKEADPIAFNRMLSQAAPQHFGHRFKITPEFKEAVEKKGFSRYKRGGPVGALNRYAQGGEVDDSPPNFTFNTPEPGSNTDSFETQSHPSGMMMPNMGFDVIPGPNNAFGDQPYDPALDAYVRQREQPMRPQLQKLAQPKSEGSGGGGGDIGSMVSMAMKFLPLLLAEGGQIDPAAQPMWDGMPGVSLYEKGGRVDVPWERRSSPESFYMDDVLNQIFEDRDADYGSRFAGEQMDLRHPFPPQRNYLGNPQDLYVPPSRRETRDAMFADGGQVSDYDLYHPIWQQSFAKGGSVLHDILGTVGGVGGTMLGSFLGGPIGGMLGGKAGRFLGSTGSNLIEGNSDEIDDEAMSIAMPTMSDARAFMSRGGALRRCA